MGLLEKIRDKPHETKIRIIWISAGVVVIALVVAWVLIGRMKLNPNESFLGNVVNRIGNPSKTFPQFFNKNSTD
jgi:hypothetical protein